MFTEKFVSASINAIMIISDSAAFCISDFDSDFKNNFVKFSVFSTVQNPHSTIPEFT